MSIDSIKITHQLKGKSNGYEKSILQQIQYKLISTTTGKYNNSLYIKEFLNFIKVHIINRNNNSNENEIRFSKLNMPMLYVIFIIKNYEFSNFNSENLDNPEYKNKVNELFKDIIGMNDNEDYIEYTLDIIRYLYIYNLIINDKYILL
ncbi:hypothetical protein BCR36DRAFT_374689 [Piromyces finnis]|uniref:Uncharacterized protein n=1 Tax=Piromyces finnis TaxID=1754191 RepID=A0A1Y1UX54_9FUNG|nr:hypothetical protein BCR36DRAFT_374689 [Piromyces finnis]|eukprot:ORX42241.1 hypothetical protein BCR36DRAFT_374689 [Piromyces finnis]